MSLWKWKIQEEQEICGRFQTHLDAQITAEGVVNGFCEQLYVL